MKTGQDERLVVENTGASPGAASAGYHATIIVSEPEHLPSVQWATREICRTLGYDEVGVDRAVVQVTDLARRRLVAAGCPGKLHLTAVKARGRLALEVRAEFEESAAYL